MRLVGAVLMGAIVFGAFSGLTMVNAVPASTAGREVRSVTPNDLKPGECASITVSSTVTGSDVIVGTGAAELVVGDANIDSIESFGGDDCVLGGAGDDVVDGGLGNDVCVGGPGIDEFIACESQFQ